MRSDFLGKKEFRQGIFFITYACILVLVLIYFKDILSGCKKILDLFAVFFLGIIFAFVLNRLFEKITDLYCKTHLKRKHAKYAALVSVYFLLALAMAALIRIVLPQVVENVKMLALNLEDRKSVV